jgi:lactate dehydrogenase-like 2-hydroxyacid dehydrogenase
MKSPEKLVSLGVRFPDAGRRTLRSAGCDLHQYAEVSEFEAALRAAEEAGAVCVSTVWLRHLPSDFISRLKRCRLLVIGGRGANSLDVNDAALRGISIAHCPRYPAPAIAEHAFALLLSLARRLNHRPERPAEPGLHSYEAAAELWKGVELRGKTLGIAGFGFGKDIGRCLARIAAGFGMKVLSVRRQQPWWLARLLFHRNVRFVKFNDMVSQSDAIVSLLPPGARGAFSEEAFARMRPGCLFVNVGRAQAVDEDALLGALKNGTGRGHSPERAVAVSAQERRLLASYELEHRRGGGTSRGRMRGEYPPFLFRSSRKYNRGRF